MGLGTIELRRDHEVAAQASAEVRIYSGVCLAGGPYSDCRFDM
jgi:hypothetical protein